MNIFKNKSRVLLSILAVTLLVNIPSTSFAYCYTSPIGNKPRCTTVAKDVLMSYSQWTCIKLQYQVFIELEQRSKWEIGTKMYQRISKRINVLEDKMYTNNCFRR